MKDDPSLERYRGFSLSPSEAERARVRRPFSLCFLLLLLFLCSTALHAQTVILHLKNGDRLAGTILSEDTNRVLLSTTWIKELAVPLSEIASREKITSETKPPLLPTPVTPPPKAAAPSVVTNTGPSVLPSARPGTPVPITMAAPPPKAKPKHWKGELKIGADFPFNAKAQEI